MLTMDYFRPVKSISVAVTLELVQLVAYIIGSFNEQFRHIQRIWVDQLALMFITYAFSQEVVHHAIPSNSFTKLANQLKRDH